MSSNASLGKRKEREEDSKVHGSTLFVSNLPYTATSVDLQTLFSDIAPVRSAFVVTEQGSGVSKGVGYVSFAIREDAHMAYDKISKEGINVAGRNLRLQWAENKPKEKLETTSEPKPRKEPHPRTSHDPFAIRTIIITGIPTTVDANALWKKVRKYAGAEKVEWPVEGFPGTAHAIFRTPRDASDAVSKLHAHVFKGALLSVTLKKRLDSLAKPSTAAPSHGSRLIIRNIPFGITEQDLRSVFLAYGPVHSISIPKSKDGRMKGFAFVWMLSKKDAERAMEECNGRKLKAGMAQGLLLDKQKKKKERRVEKKLENGAETHEALHERIIAVDWALSKDRWEEEKAKLQDEEDDGDENMDGSQSSDSNSDPDSESDSESDDRSDDGLGVHERDSDDESEVPIKPELPPPETGTTLFIRNVPFSASEDDLRTLFRAFGPLRYARITLDYDSGRSRGTGFACFWNKEDADKVIEHSELLRSETMGTEAPKKKNPFSLPSILTPDPSSTLARSLVLDGRTLDVVRAVTRDEAGKLKEEGEKRREKADKRNLYLLREGVILSNTPAAETLNPTDIEQRTASFTSRRALLKSNPSLYVSRTRLSIRQIPVFVTERMLKRLALHSIKAFKADVKSGLRKDLSLDELTEVKPDIDDDVEPVQRKKSGVKQSKIVRQHERVDPVTGKGRSRGYGFVEMYKHADSLRCLRWANNNPDIGVLFEEWWKVELNDLVKAEMAKPDKDEDRLKRMKHELENGAQKKSKGTLIVEFSIENVQVVQRRDAMQKDHRAMPEDKAPAKVETDKRPAKKLRPIPDNPGQSIGSMIGRKRKQRKAGKRG